MKNIKLLMILAGALVVQQTVIQCGIPEKMVINARRGVKSKVKKLIEGGANVNAQDKHGTKPLQAAASTGQLAMVDFLLDQGAELDGVDEEGTALYAAVLNKKKDMVIDLLRRGANPNKARKHGTSACDLALRLKSPLLPLLSKYIN